MCQAFSVFVSNVLNGSSKSIRIYSTYREAIQVRQLVEKSGGLSRRAFLRCLGAVLALTAAARELLLGAEAPGQAASLGLPLPEERVEATLKRLFGNRPLNQGDGKVRLELPLIAEDGANVAVTVEANLPMTTATYVSNIYIISDKNRRPMIAKFSLTPEAGRAFIATSIRLAATTDVRAVVEMNDGILYAASKHVRVTVSGCGDVPQS